jgi:hypothetical protein
MKFRLITDGIYIVIYKRFFLWETEVLRVNYTEEDLFSAIDYLNNKNEEYYGR